MIKVSPSALTELKRIAASEEKEARVRVTMKGGGCSGFTVTMDFTQWPPDEEIDLTFDFDGVIFIIDEKSAFFLQDASLDYGGSLLDKGFKWTFPKATGGCGCGSSFSF